MSEPEKIKESAIWIQQDHGRIFTGVNHGMAWLNAEDHYGGETKVPQRGVVEGFITTTGRFVTREEASIIADRSLQVPYEEQLGGPKYRKLMAEDLNINAYEDENYQARLGSRLAPLGKQGAVPEADLADRNEIAQRFEAKRAKEGANVVPLGNTPKPPGMDPSYGAMPGTRLTDLY
jgi:hypothetical protein